MGLPPYVAVPISARTGAVPTMRRALRRSPRPVLDMDQIDLWDEGGARVYPAGFPFSASASDAVALPRRAGWAWLGSGRQPDR